MCYVTALKWTTGQVAYQYRTAALSTTMPLEVSLGLIKAGIRALLVEYCNRGMDRRLASKNAYTGLAVFTIDISPSDILVDQVGFLFLH